MNTKKIFSFLVLLFTFFFITGCKEEEITKMELFEQKKVKCHETYKDYEDIGPPVYLDYNMDVGYSFFIVNYNKEIESFVSLKELSDKKQKIINNVCGGLLKYWQMLNSFGPQERLPTPNFLLFSYADYTIGKYELLKQINEYELNTE